MKSVSISSKHLRNFDLELQVKFLITQFRKANLEITALPSPELLVTLRSLNCATLEVLEILSTATVYRIKPTGYTYLVYKDGQTFTFSSYQVYISLYPELRKSATILESKDPVYTIDFNSYIPMITRHKPPRFLGSINKQSIHLDTGPEWKIDITDINWLDGHENLSATQYASLMKKTVLFVLGNTNILDEQMN